MTYDPWHYYSRALDRYKEQLDQLEYMGVVSKLPEPRLRTQGFFSIYDVHGPLTPDSIKLLLSESALGPPHGFDLLKPLPLPTFPVFPKRPETSPPVQKPQGGFSIFGSPWRPPKDEVNPKITDKEDNLRKQASQLRQKFEQKYQTAKSQGFSQGWVHCQ